MSNQPVIPPATPPPAAPARAKRRRYTAFHFESKSIPLVAFVCLAAGFLLGFLSQPVIVSAITTASTGDRMQTTIAQTRHFIGSEDAPVTIIEFSDFL